MVSLSECTTLTFCLTSGVQSNCTLQNQLNGSGTCTWATGLGQSGSGNVNLMQTAYLVVTNCGSSFQISCSPSVLCTVPAGSVYSYGGGSVSYKAAAAPIVIQGWGTIPDSTGSGANVLVGQGVRAFLTALGSNTSVAFSSYNWGISGAVTGFATGSTPTSHGHVINLNASDLQSASPHWYWAQGTASGTSATITCNAMASINGVSIGIVNATGHVNVFSPPHLWGHAHTSVQIVGQGTSGVSLTTDMPWTLQVVTPPPFSTYYNNLGYYYLTQLCSLNRDLGSTDPLGLDITVNTGGFVLDGEQIYSTIDVPGGTWPADGKQNTSGDTPTIGLDLKSAVTQHDAWQAFLMYMPPGPDSLAVPIHELDWKVDCDDHLLLGHGGEWSPNPPRTVVVTGDVSFDTSPANWPGWDDVYTGSGA